MLKEQIVSITKDRKYWLLAILVFLSFEPYFIWHIGYRMYWLTIPILLLFFANSDKKVFSQPYFLFWLFVVFVAALCSRNNVFGMIMMLLICGLVFVVKDDCLYRVYKKVYLIYSFTILLSMLVWVMVVVLSIHLPYRITEPVIAIKDYNYIVYPFLVRVNLDSFNFESISAMYRFCGLYDEPGVVGTISFLLLCVEKFNMKNRWNVVLLISGLISMSLFFYIAFAVYLVFIMVTSQSIKLWRKVLVLIAFLGFAAFSYSNEILNTLIWSRIEGRGSAGEILDSRSTDELRNYVDQIAFSSDYFFGVDDRSLIERFSSSSSIYNVIIGYGMISIILYSIFFIIYSLKFSTTTKSAFVCIAVIALTLVQRPGLFILYYLFLFRCMIEVPSIEERLIPINQTYE